MDFTWAHFMNPWQLFGSGKSPSRTEQSTILEPLQAVVVVGAKVVEEGADIGDGDDVWDVTPFWESESHPPSLFDPISM